MTTKKNENENVKVTTTHAARRCKAQPARNGQPKSVETNGHPLNQSKIKKVHRVITTDDANEQEKQQAREVLPAVMGSDVWDEMLDEFEGARQRVARLMNNSNV